MSNYGVVIRTKNEIQNIGKLLDFLEASYEKNVEVVVVDNKSTDGTIREVQSRKVRILEIDQFVPGVAINMGIARLESELIAIISGHCLPISREWLCELGREFTDDSIAGVFGRQIPTEESTDNDVRDLWTVFGNDRLVMINNPMFHNANSMIRRSVWELFPFNENARSIEDRIWAKKVLSHGYRIVYTPNASVLHPHGINHNGDIVRAKRVVDELRKFSVYE